jgi:hypothetical protein
MNPTIQPGMHPDAEILTAFAEELVTSTEREDVLAHIAICGRCREVVFLTQRMMQADQPSQSTAVPLPEVKTGSAWFANWRWTWVPVAALAGIVGVAVIQQHRRTSSPPMQMAQNAPPPATPQIPEERKPAATSELQKQPSRSEFKQKSASREDSERDSAEAQRSFDEEDKHLAQKKDQRALAADSLTAPALKDSASAVHGTFEARAKSPAIGGPMTQNQVQQQNNTQQQNYANEALQGGAAPNSANKPASPQRVSPAAASKTVTVQAEGSFSPAPPAPAAPSTLSATQLQTESVDLAGKNLAKLESLKSVLPSRLSAVSEAAAGKRMIAIDTAGTVFRTEDAGEHWEKVNSKWSGRAVLVKTISPSGQVTGNVFSRRPVQFELLTDKFETWTSMDGKIWTMQPPAAK